MKRINTFLNGLTEPDSSNPTVLLLAELIRELEEKNQLLKDEIARLKNNNSRPKIRPSTLDGKDSPSSARTDSKKTRKHKMP
ncbi:hypothetical protein LJC22_04695 [Desulfosarcina sp. OttesenSCG-928-G10]|nr:hypothetical protein [Desulfosarcina sp. OttesenSCG-928-G10]